MERENQEAALSSHLLPISQVEEDVSNSKQIEGQKGNIKNAIKEELKKQLWLAGPLISANLLLYLVQVISVMFVGHLGQLALSGASMATSFASVTGFSLMMGMSSALDTLCGQSHGAKQHHMLGIHLQRAMVVLLLVSIPVAIVWANTGPILIALGQDVEISEAAGLYARYLIPTIFAQALFQCLMRFLRSQNIVLPIMLYSGTITLFHLFICWVLTLKLNMGYRGAAVAISITYWMNVVMLGLYVKFSSSCKKSWPGFSKEAFRNIVAFIRLAIPSAIMVCFEVWSFELMVLLSGFLPNPKLQTSVLSICLNTTAIVWMIPSGLSSTVSTRVSNELGAGNSQAARLAAYVVLLIVTVEGILLFIVTILIRNIWGYAYSNEVAVVKSVAEMMPIIATSNLIDGIQGVLSGTARGCGWQKIGAFINLGSYYILGIPSAIILAFVFHYGGKGLWVGIIIAVSVQGLCFLILTIFTDWEKERRYGCRSMMLETVAAVPGMGYLKEEANHSYTQFSELDKVNIKNMPASANAIDDRQFSHESTLRPLSPHILIYKPQSNSTLSILNRISGALLATTALGFHLIYLKIGLICFTYWNFYQFLFYSSKLIPIYLSINALALAFHVFKGLRLLWGHL